MALASARFERGRFPKALLPETVRALHGSPPVSPFRALLEAPDEYANA